MYDLKGSTICREVKVDLSNLHKIVLKDVNFLELEKNLMLNDNDKIRINEIVMKDANFLGNLDIMDYSLFVVKLNMNEIQVNSLFIKSEIIFGNQIGDKKENLSINDEDMTYINFSECKYLRKYLFKSLNPNVSYIIAIIDFFQLYNFSKFIETKFKYYIKNRPEKITEISSVPSDVYSNRFIEFIGKITMLNSFN